MDQMDIIESPEMFLMITIVVHEISCLEITHCSHLIANHLGISSCLTCCVEHALSTAVTCHSVLYFGRIVSENIQI